MKDNKDRSLPVRGQRTKNAGKGRKKQGGKKGSKR